MEKKWRVWNVCQNIISGIMFSGIPMFIWMTFVRPLLEKIAYLPFAYLFIVVVISFLPMFAWAYCLKVVVSKQYLKAFLWFTPVIAAAAFLMNHPLFEVPESWKIKLDFVVWGVFFGIMIGVMNPRKSA